MSSSQFLLHTRYCPHCIFTARQFKRSLDFQTTFPYLDTIRAILAILLALILLLLYIYYTHALYTALF